jgi:hypothetical protein
MYKDEQKALFMTKDQQLKEKMETYLYHRYNLRTEFVDELMEVLNWHAADDSPESEWNLVILDESAAGLQTTAQVLKTLKARYNDINVLYLSTILEITGPYAREEMKLLPEYSNEEYRQTQMDMQVDKILELMIPLTKASSLADVYDTIPKTMAKTYKADWALCSVLRLDEKPVQRGAATGDYPGILDIPYEYPLKGTGYLEEMLFNFKPVHIPDLDKDKAFRDELEEKFSRRYRSALLLPMQYEGQYIGFNGLFTRQQPRLYTLPDLDILQRLADISTAVIITHFYKEQGALDMDKIRKKMKKETLDDTMDGI